MQMKVALAQMMPLWLNREATLAKIEQYVAQAARQDCQLVVFGEALLPGYPFWLDLTGGAEFDSATQKTLYAHYANNAVDIEAGGLDSLTQLAARQQIAIYLGCIEKPLDRGGHSLYCSLVYIDPEGQIGSVHRKLCPTYEERLVWSPGDGHGLAVHPLNGFRLGGLNCWENWMPLARSSLYAQGENVHIAVWPGSRRNSDDITRFIARESRSYVISVSGLLHRDQIPADLPHADLISQAAPAWLADGGSCVAAPDGSWLLPPQTEAEDLYMVELDLNRVMEERQNFDPSGHYARPDVTRLQVNRRRQSSVEFLE